jgi:aspartokinase/homoserine dehydrogenase 1
VDVHKFGGTSVASADRYRHVARILAERGTPPGRRRLGHGRVTDALLRSVRLAARREDSYRDELEQLRNGTAPRCVSCSRPRPEELLDRLERDFTDLADVLHAIWLVRAHSDAALDLVTGFGELWSAQILAAHMRASGQSVCWLDARDVLVVNRGAAGIAVEWDTSAERLQQWLAALPEQYENIVITGYVAATPMVCRPRSAATAATSRPRSSVRCWTRARSTSGRMSMA